MKGFFYRLFCVLIMFGATTEGLLLPSHPGEDRLNAVELNTCDFPGRR